MSSSYHASSSIFQSTLPARGATPQAPTPQLGGITFQSTLPARGATEPPAAARAASNFNPRSPHGERPDGDAQAPPRKISIHAPRTGSDQSRQPPPEPPAISIPAPRTGSDPAASQPPARASNFNPRSPHGERRQPPARASSRQQFQSTLPARGATSRTPGKVENGHNFNPRSPHGERHTAKEAVIDAIQFQSTLPARGATAEAHARWLRAKIISIHAPRTGSDPQARRRGRPDTISIHAPRTGSDTTDGDAQAPPRKISIHAPRTGSDGGVHSTST